MKNDTVLKNICMSTKAANTNFGVKGMLFAGHQSSKICNLEELAFSIL
jgi:hypothetical protein